MLLNLTCYTIQMIDPDLQNLDVIDYISAQMNATVNHPHVALYKNLCWASGYIIHPVDSINSQICKYLFYLLVHPCCQIPAAVILHLHSCLWCFDSPGESIVTDKDVTSPVGTGNYFISPNQSVAVKTNMYCKEERKQPPFTIKCIKL